MNPSVHAMSVPQLFSHDYYCRIDSRKLGDMQLSHSFTEPDPLVCEEVLRSGMAVRRAGITEWEGLVDGHPVSLGWDWMELHDGEIRPVTRVPPRTSLMLLDGKGYDVPQAAQGPMLWDLISRLSWRQSVADSLRALEPALSC